MEKQTLPAPSLPRLSALRPQQAYRKLASSLALSVLALRSTRGVYVTLFSVCCSLVSSLVRGPNTEHVIHPSTRDSFGLPRQIFPEEDAFDDGSPGWPVAVGGRLPANTSQEGEEGWRGRQEEEKVNTEVHGVEWKASPFLG